MKNRCKLLVLCFAMIISFLLVPVSTVYADETASGETNDRTSFPRLNSSEVKFEKKNFNSWFGFKDVPEENCIEEFVLAHKKALNVDYTLYELMCDFELKTMGEGEEYNTSTYSYTIDFADYERGFFDDLLVRFNLKEDYYEHIFNYFEIVRNADGFKERDITGKGKYFTYNTVISKADFYFVRKSDGEIGQARRFTFTWDSDFWIQKCTKIDFAWYVPEEDYEKPVSSVENINGVDGFTSNTTDSYLDLEVSVWDGILGFFTDLPAAVIAFFTGFFQLTDSLNELISVVFPFIPASIISILLIMMCFILIVAVYRFVRGLFG